MLRSIVVVLLFIFHAAAAAAAGILVVGDSLSASYGIPQDQSWPALLARRLAEQRYNYSVANASISGETTAGGRARFDAALKQHQPKIVILALGANDGLRGLPVTVMRDNLDAMIKASQAAHAKVVLVGMRLPPNYGQDYTQKFQQAYSDLARSEKTTLVPFIMEGFADRHELFQPDGMHPTAAAQPLILDNVWAGLQPLLKQKP